jgi:hypothetical protein
VIQARCQTLDKQVQELGERQRALEQDRHDLWRLAERGKDPAVQVREAPGRGLEIANRERFTQQVQELERHVRELSRGRGWGWGR